MPVRSKTRYGELGAFYAWHAVASRHAEAFLRTRKLYTKAGRRRRVAHPIRSFRFSLDLDCYLSGRSRFARCGCDRPRAKSPCRHGHRRELDYSDDLIKRRHAQRPNGAGNDYHNENGKEEPIIETLHGVTVYHLVRERQWIKRRSLIAICADCDSLDKPNGLNLPQLQARGL